MKQHGLEMWAGKIYNLLYSGLLGIIKFKWETKDKLNVKPSKNGNGKFNKRMKASSIAAYLKLIL